MVSIDFEFDGTEEFSREIERTAEEYGSASGYRVVNPTEYAAIIEYGRGPIRPKSAEALRFEINGEVVFTQYSGPVPPQPMLRPAVDEAKADVARIARTADSLDELLTRVAFAIESGAKQRTPVDTGQLRSAWSTRPL